MSADLFDQPSTAKPRAVALSAPLAERLRPHTLDEVVGQSHLLGPSKPLRLAFEAKKLHSMIFWGPPGVGKTTLARLMADAFGAEFIAISAVLAGVKEIREAVERARFNRSQGRATILFVDEVHRFNKAQQDAFLPHVEEGLITFIGATTENPSFEVVSALLSRAAVYVLEPLNADELRVVLERGLAMLVPPIALDEGARAALVSLADGDARRLLNALEQVHTAALQAHPPAAQAGAAAFAVDEAFVGDVLSRKLRRFDKGGENFYDLISALHKSVRGSNVDASLYWFARMLDGGCDPRYIGRRMVRMASEDIGLADPRALEQTLAAWDTYERLGSPEGELALAQALVYLTLAPKSNAVYKAFGAAKAFVAQDDSRPVPLHLRNAPTKLMKDLGYSKGYRYAHNEADAFAAGEDYFPPGMPEVEFYRPSDRGFEQRLKEKLDALRERDRTVRQTPEGTGPKGK